MEHRPAWDERHHLSALEPRQLARRPKFRTMNGAPVRPVLVFEKKGRRIVHRNLQEDCNGKGNIRPLKPEAPKQPREVHQAKSKPEHITHSHRSPPKQNYDLNPDSPAELLPEQPKLTIEAPPAQVGMTSIESVIDENCTCVRDLVRLMPIGRGSSACVYKSLHVPSLQIIAEKALPMTTPDTCTAIAQEVAMTSELLQASATDDGKCPYLVDVIRIEPDHKQNTLCICTEFMDGGSLQDIVAAGGCQDEQVLAGVAKQILLGIEYMHRRQVIHRDIKPGNLLINHWGIVKISDFGIARYLETQLEADTFVGTYSYMSPERIIGETYSYASDIWSFGLSLLALLLGRHPCEGTGNREGYWGFVEAICGQEVRVPSYCSTALRDFLSACLQQNPADRLTAAALLQHEFMTKHKMGVDDLQLPSKLSIRRCASKPNPEEVDPSVMWLAEQTTPHPVSNGTRRQSKIEDTATNAELTQVREAIKSYYIDVWRSTPCPCSGHKQDMIPQWNKTAILRLAKQLAVSEEQANALFRPLVNELKYAAQIAILEHSENSTATPTTSPDQMERSESIRALEDSYASDFEED